MDNCLNVGRNIRDQDRGYICLHETLETGFTLISTA